MLAFFGNFDREEQDVVGPTESERGDGVVDDNCAEGFCAIAADDLPEAVWRILATGNFPEGFWEIYADGNLAEGFCQI